MKPQAAHCAAALVAAVVLAAGLAQAQEARWRPFVSVTPVYEGDADLDQGGDFNVWRALVSAGVEGEIARGVSGGVTLNYGYSDYSFSNPAAFGGVAPWNIVQRYGVAIPLSLGLRDDWSLDVVPSVDWFKENGADTGDSLVWGGLVSATKRFADGNELGFGVGVFDRIEKTSVFPYLLVDWRLSDRWRLINPLAVGPTGAAGLELSYLLGGGWTMGLGVAYRSTRFRLSNSGPVPNGVGEERGVPVFLRATRDFGPALSLHLYAGVVAGGELRVEDPSGNLLRKDDFDPQPFLAATFVARF